MNRVLRPLAVAVLVGMPSAQSVKLNGPLARELRSGTVTEFHFTQDGTRVVYRAEQVSADRYELFSRPLDGSDPSTLLSGPMQPNGDVAASGISSGFFQIGAGERVVPQVLGAPLATGRDVTAFALAPDQSRVVYLADPRLDDVFEFFSVPFGGGAVVALDTLPAFGDVAEFHVDPSSLTVAYTADRNTNAVLELFRVPLDGSLVPVQLNPTLVQGGSVQPGFVALPGVTLYRADQQKDEVFELYLAF